MNYLTPLCPLPSMLAAAAAASLVFAANDAAKLSTEAMLASEWKRVRDLGDPTTLGEVAAPGVPPERNAAVPFGRAGDVAEGVFEVLETDLRGHQVNDWTNYDLSDKVLQTLSVGHRYHRFMDEADRLPDFGCPANLTWRRDVDDPLEGAKRIALVEVIRSRNFCAQRNHADGCRTVLRLLRILAKSAKGVHTLEDYRNWTLTRWRCFGELDRILCETTLPRELHDQIEAVLHAENLSHTAFRRSLVESRLLAHTLHDHPDLEWMKAPALRAWANLDSLVFLRATQELIDACAKPYAEAREVFRRVARRVDSRPIVVRAIPGAFLGLYLTEYQRALPENDLARSRCLRIVNAMSRSGSVSTRLDGMKLPADCKLDPFNGRPLQIQLKLNGVVVYSVGSDLKDGGGDLRNTDVGYGPELRYPSLRH